MKNKTNPIVSKVVDTYQTVQEMTEMFVMNKDSISRGLLISGNAGMGKTHYVQAAFEATGQKNRVQYVKASSLSSAAMFCILHASSKPGKIVVFDDTDLIHKSSQEVATILDLLKGATEPTMGERILSWHRATTNPLMVQLNVPASYDFQGTIVWITNDSIEDMRKKAKGHWNAISSRFTQIEAWFNDQEKIEYTLHLIAEENILGDKCTVRKNGWSKEVVDNVCEYMRTNYRQLRDITPRVALKIADVIDTYPTKWRTYCDNQFLSNS